jgi:hypothetical protein
MELEGLTESSDENGFERDRYRQHLTEFHEGSKERGKRRILYESASYQYYYSTSFSKASKTTELLCSQFIRKQTLVD